MGRVELKDRHHLPNKPGIYQAKLGNQILYIGMAGKQGLRQRWGKNSGYGDHFKLHQLSQAQEKAGKPVFLEYRVYPLWRVAHEEAIALRRYHQRHGRLPKLNRRLEPTVWWVGAIDVFITISQVVLWLCVLALVIYFLG